MQKGDTMFTSVLKWLKTVFTPSRPPVIKMYVLVRTDMPPIHRAVQGMHAVAAYLINGNNTLVAWSANQSHKSTWTNGYLITLGVDNEAELCRWENQLSASGKTFATFVEPDWEGGPTKTALACISYGEEFVNLPLLTMNDTREQKAPVFEQIHI
jgi:hypothetical protein